MRTTWWRCAFVDVYGCRNVCVCVYSPAYTGWLPLFSFWYISDTLSTANCVQVVKPGMCDDCHLKDFRAEAATSFNFCRTQRVPFVALAPIFARHQAEAESFVCLKVEICSCLSHFEADHLVLPHASNKCQLNFCMWGPCVVNATDSTTHSRCPCTSCPRMSWSYAT